jgi:hypothetical protein
MKIAPKSYSVIGSLNVILGTVVARNSINALKQAKQMFGPLVSVEMNKPLAMYNGVKAPKVAAPKAPANPAFGPGQKAAFTKLLMSMADAA